MNGPDERLDIALEHFLEHGEMSEELQAHSEVLQALQTLAPVPARNPGRAKAIRQAFLERAASLPQTVSAGQDQRLKGWKSIFRKERSPMFTIARIISIAAILLGGTAGTAFAARESLPDQALYPLKTLIEDVRLGLTTDPQAEFDLLMTLVEERFSEIQAIAQNGDAVDEQVQIRLQNHLRFALQSAASLDDAALVKAMERVRERSREQLQILKQINHGPGGNLQLVEQALIRSRIRAEGALEDPNTLRMRYGAERNEDAPDQPEEVIPPAGGKGNPPGGAGGSESPAPSGSGEGNFGSPGARRKGISE